MRTQVRSNSRSSTSSSQRISSWKFTRAVGDDKKGKDKKKKKIKKKYTEKGELNKRKPI